MGIPVWGRCKNVLQKYEMLHVVEVVMVLDWESVNYGKFKPDINFSYHNPYDHNKVGI